MNLDFYSGKRVFVTGHTGFKGAWLSKILLTAGADVTGFALDPPTDPALFSLLNLSNDMESIIGDVRDYDHMLAAMKAAKPEIVLHLAAQPIVRTSYEEPRYTFETNVMGTVNMLESVRMTDTVRSVVNVTTDKVYLNVEREEGYTEDEPLDGYDPYSNSKSCSDLVTHSYVNSFFNAPGGPAVSTARAGNVIGGGDFARDRILPDCVRAMEKGEPIIIRNPGSVRPFQHVLEPLSAYLLLAERQYDDKSLAGAYNVGPNTGDTASAGEIADCFVKAWGGDARWITRGDGGPHEAGLLALNSDKIQRNLGWRPRWNIMEAVEKTVEWSKIYVAGGDVLGITEAEIKEYFD